jgi:hypothetical protein
MMVVLPRQAFEVRLRTTNNIVIKDVGLWNHINPLLRNLTYLKTRLPNYRW